MGRGLRHIGDTYGDFEDFQEGRENPYYRRALRENPLADTPLFEAAKEEPVPPKTLHRSATQMESFDMIKDKLTERQQQVYSALLERGPSTTADLSEFMDWSINLVSGRISELTEQGYVTESHRVVNPKTNRPNSVWKAIV